MSVCAMIALPPLTRAPGDQPPAACTQQQLCCLALGLLRAQLGRVGERWGSTACPAAAAPHALVLIADTSSMKRTWTSCASTGAKPRA